MSTRGRAIAFAQLHAGPEAFVIPNPWDAGSAKLLAQLGFAALATTSAGLAHSLGRPDCANRVNRYETILNARNIAEATPLPVTADLERCFGETDHEIATTIRMAAQAGLVGGSIEDATGRRDHPIYPLDEAVRRCAAAVEAARRLPFPFTVTARAENFLHGRADLRDTIRRLQAYAEAGADVLYAPGLSDLDAVAAVCEAVSKPVNVLASPMFTVKELSAAGVRRISLGSGLSRAALGAMMRAATEILDHGTFGFATEALPYAQANTLLSQEG